MSSPSISGPFRIVEHQVPCQHIREYPAATANEQEDTLYLSVRQYIPLDNPNPRSGDVTIVAAHANGFPKELYEPLWEDLSARSKANGFRIRSIWMADVAHQGQSSVINEDLLGNDPSWLDHPRDLLHLINLKRDEMPRPIVGIGHSFGGAQLAQLSLMHPRLIHTLVLLDPVIQAQTTQFDSESVFHMREVIAKTTQMSTYRRDIWPSRKAAAEGFKRNPFYQAWDPRVLERWLKYGLRELPTAIYPLDESTRPKGSSDGDDKPVTLRTTRHQEVFTFSRPNYDGPPGKDVPLNKVTHPDLDPKQFGSFPFYRSEPMRVFMQLPYLRPSVLYIFGGTSDMSLPQMIEEKLAHTGVGISGSGGVAAGRVRHVSLDKIGHLVAQEAPTQCADHAAGWLGSELRRFQEEEEAFKAQWSRKSKVQKLTIDQRWLDHVPRPQRKPKNTPAGGESKSKL